MAKDLPRTADDERADALAAARALERELPHLIAHLTVPGRPEPATLWQAVRLGRILSDLSAQVVQHAGRGAERAAGHHGGAGPLRVVSSPRAS